MQLIDPIIGSLDLNYIWTREYTAQVFRSMKTIELNVEANEREHITDGQRAAFRLFDKQASFLIDNAITAVHEFYLKNRESFLEYIDEDDWEELAPIANGAFEMDGLLTLETIRVLRSEEENRRVALFFSATFEDELGISVLFVNEQVNLVVTDIVY